MRNAKILAWVLGMTSFWPLFQFRKLMQHQILAYYSLWFEINQSFFIVLVSGNPSKGLQWTSQDEGGTWWESRQHTRSTISSGTDFLIWKMQIFFNLNVPGSSLRVFLTWSFSKTASKKRTSPLSSRRSPMTDTKFTFRWEWRSFPQW